MNSYTAALSYLYNQLPMFQRTGPAAYKHSLDNTLRLDAMYDHPHRRFRTVHVAGTNGKGSVSHMMASVLQSAGYRTGLYTSPHLKDFRERIRINGEMIPQSFVTEWVGGFIEKNREAEIEPSFFELTMIMAFEYFACEEVDVAVIEVGLGGRLDSTNIITPELSMITNISYDHMSLLGETLPLIAGEKAGIIKPGVPVIISERQSEVEEVFVQKAAETGSPLFFAGMDYQAEAGLTDMDGNQVFQFRKAEALVYPDLKVELPGIYQKLNIPAVLKSVDILRDKGWEISRRAVYEGLAHVRTQTGLQGRWQVLGANPRIVCDTGHNEEGIRQVTQQISQTPYKKLHIVFGTVEDKDPAKVLALLPKDAIYYFCQADIPRAMNARTLQMKAGEAGLYGQTYPSVGEAFTAARQAAGPHDFIFIGGSTFVVAEIL